MRHHNPDNHPVLAAASAIRPQAYQGGGDAVRPVVTHRTLVRHLRILRVRPGMRVLQVATGTGYAAALLSHMVGPEGSVTTLDIDPDLSERAAKFYAQYGHPVSAVVDDGVYGWPDGAPYDRIFVAATPPAIPRAWLDQLASGGEILTGCAIAPLPGADAVAHIVDAGARVQILADQYPPMLTLGSLHPSARVTAPDNPAFELATLAPTSAEHAARLLQVLRMASAQPEPWTRFLSDYADFRAWLIARNPPGLLAASTELGAGIGIGSPDGDAHVALVTQDALLTRPTTSPVARRLRDLIEEWRVEGEMRCEALPASLVQVPGRDAFTVVLRLQDREPAPAL